jgi:hypothetical protein
LKLCDSTAECERSFGAPSVCGWSTTVDGYQFATCADWGEALELPPDGTTCFDDTQCNLGNGGHERVCSFSTCAEGCYSEADCPEGSTCPTSGQLAHCE